MTPRNAEDLRRSLDARLTREARLSGSDVNRLRRQFAFHRVVARLAADSRWVLKGGYALEVRLVDRARATRDVDVALLDTGVEVAEALGVALARDPDGDTLDLVPGLARSMRAMDHDPAAWRFLIDVRLAGRTFERVRLDVSMRLPRSTADLGGSPSRCRWQVSNCRTWSSRRWTSPNTPRRRSTP